MKVAKTPYYLGSLARLVVLARLRSLAARLLRPRGTLVLRDGLGLRVRRRIDLLVLEETLGRDTYGLRELGPAARTIVDVGAGVGEFALAAARAFPHARVVAVEPDGEAFELLAENVAASGVQNVELRHAAVGTSSAYELRRDGPFAAVTPAAAEGVAAVAGVRLDELVGDVPVDLLKVDCEGAELDVLASLDRALGRVRRIVVEYHGAGRGDEVRALLERHGLEVTVAPDRYTRGLGYVRAVARDREPPPLDGRRDPL